MRILINTFRLCLIPCLVLGLKASGSLPPIEAKSYNLTPKKTSTSKRVVLFSSPPEGTPVDRKILLLRRDGQNTMAFRVVKNFKERNEFAATRVREYRDIKELELNFEYRALEKVGDLAPVPSAEERAKDEADLKEFDELPAAPPPPSGDAKTEKPAMSDAALDGELPVPAEGSAEGPAEGDEALDGNGENSQTAALDEDIPEVPSSLMLRETPDFDPDDNALGGEFAYLRNVRGFYFSAGGLRYARTLSRSVPMGGAAQSSWSLDAGIYLYRVSNYGQLALDENSSAEDSFSLMPLAASVRYTVMTTADLGFFAYAGLSYTFIVGAFNGSPDDPDAVNLFEMSSAELGSLGIMGGVGLIYRFGPRWNLRADAGWDRIGVSVMLRF